MFFFSVIISEPFYYLYITQRLFYLKYNLQTPAPNISAFRCQSPIGRRGGPQEITIGGSCQQSVCSRWSTLYNKIVFFKFKLLCFFFLLKSTHWFRRLDPLPMKLHIVLDFTTSTLDQIGTITWLLTPIIYNRVLRGISGRLAPGVSRTLNHTMCPLWCIMVQQWVSHPVTWY